MFEIIKRLAWIREGSTGKREFAVIILVTAVAMTFWFGGALDSKDLRNVVEWWIIAAIVVGLGAFGFEAYAQAFLDKFGGGSPATPTPDPETGVYVSEPDYAPEETPASNHPGF